MTSPATRLGALLLTLLLTACGEPPITALRLTGSGGSVTEAGGQATFYVSLSRKPVGTLVLHLVSTDETEGTVEPASMIFDANTWETPQKVTVTGVDDDLADGRVLLSVRMTVEAPEDDDFHEGVWNLPFPCADDEVARLEVTGPTSLAEGAEGVLTVALSAAPVSEVTVAVSVSDDSELSVSAPTLHFTPENWQTPQEVVLTAQHDDEADGDQAITVTLAPSAAEDNPYGALSPLAHALVVTSE